MFDQLLEQFLASPDAEEARAALREQHGLSNTTAQDSLAETARALHATAASEPQGLVGHQGGLLGAIVGMLPGLVGGGTASAGNAGGPLTGRAGDMISKRTGIDPRTAGIIAATAVPFLLRFLKQRASQASQAPMMPPAASASPMQPTPGMMPPPQPQPPMTVPSASEKAPMAPDAKTPKAPMDPGAKTEKRQGDATKPWKRML